MAEKRDTYKYQFVNDNTIMEMGITDDIEKKRDELLQAYQCMYGFIEQVGMEPVTRTEAERWLERMRRHGMPMPEGEAP